MNRFHFHLAALFIALTMASSAAAQTITGTVKDGDKPLKNLRVHASTKKFNTRTDSLGRYKFSDIPKGKTIVEVFASVFGNRTTSREIEITSDSQTVNLDFQWPDKTLNCDSTAIDYHEHLKQAVAKDKRAIELKVVDAWLKDSTLIVRLEIINHSDVDIYLPRGNQQSLPYSVGLLSEDGSGFPINAQRNVCGLEANSWHGIYWEEAVVKIAPHESVLIEPLLLDAHYFGRVRFERGQLVARYSYSPEREWEWETAYTRSESKGWLEHKDSAKKAMCKIFRLPLTSEPEPLIVKYYGRTALMPY
ncbi:MAG: carboxypeptidase regulatory-like domain-containing protein [Rhizobacter sp.]|nr:carboxypeptidase regulatory-like domain-containing protein [Chlorobiales bacterium]